MRHKIIIQINYVRLGYLIALPMDEVVRLYFIHANIIKNILDAKIYLGLMENA